MTDEESQVYQLAREYEEAEAIWDREWGKPGQQERSDQIQGLEERLRQLLLRNGQELYLFRDQRDGEKLLFVILSDGTTPVVGRVTPTEVEA